MLEMETRLDFFGKARIAIRENKSLFRTKILGCAISGQEVFQRDGLPARG